MLGELITAILSLIKKGNYGQANKALENAYQQFLQEDAAYFRILPMDKITSTLLQNHNYTHQHLEILAELFRLEAKINEARGQKDLCQEFAQKARLLFEYVDKAYRTYSEDRNNKIKELERMGK